MSKFRLISFSSDEVHTFESVRELCDHIIDTSLEKGDYYVIETKVINEKFDPTHDLSRIKEKRKTDKAKDVEGEVVKKEPRTVEGEIVPTVIKKKPKITH
jgi:hypothetical protein